MAVQETAAHGWRVLRDGAIAARETGTGQDPRYTASGITMSRESDSKAGATVHQKAWLGLVCWLYAAVRNRQI